MLKQIPKVTRDDVQQNPDLEPCLADEPSDFESYPVKKCLRAVNTLVWHKLMLREQEIQTIMTDEGLSIEPQSRMDSEKESDIDKEKPSARQIYLAGAKALSKYCISDLEVIAGAISFKYDGIQVSGKPWDLDEAKAQDTDHPDGSAIGVFI